VEKQYLAYPIGLGKYMFRLTANLSKKLQNKASMFERAALNIK